MRPAQQRLAALGFLLQGDVDGQDGPMTPLRKSTGAAVAARTITPTRPLR